MESAYDAAPAPAEFAGLPEAATERLATAFDALCLTVLPFRDRWDEYRAEFAPKARSQTLSERRIGFLDLPGELRNRVYAIALSGHNIHIERLVVSTFDPKLQHSLKEIRVKRHTYVRRFYRTNRKSKEYFRFRRTLCEVPCHFNDAYEMSKALSGQDDDTVHTETDINTHKSCRDKLGLSERKFRSKFQFASRNRAEHFASLPLLPLNILATCRQVHNEASLIPFATNTFSFENDADLTDLIFRALTAQQRSAMATIHFAIHSSTSHDHQHPLLSALYQSTIAALTGLREFRMTLTGQKTITAPSHLCRVKFNKEADRKVVVKALFAPNLIPVPRQGGKVDYRLEWDYSKPRRTAAWELEEAFGRNADMVAEFGWVALRRGLTGE